MPTSEDTTTKENSRLGANPAKATVYSVLAEFREEAQNNRDLGDRFERLICRYLELDPTYAERFSGVWLWNELPQKGHEGGVGICICT
ncbi:MAG: hypothetical protein WCL27_19080 [Betaproteobacteria bacterium]